MARRKSPSPKPGQARTEKREAARFTLILRAGKLVTGHGEYLCILRDVSSGGLKVRMFHPLSVSDACDIELAGGERYRLEPIWQDGDTAGFRFVDGPIDPARLLEEAGPYPKRSIRLRLADPVPVRLQADGPAIAAHLRDISQYGLALTCLDRLPIGQQLDVCAPHMGAIEARIRWRRGDLYGLVFQQGYRLDDLARLAKQLQSPEQAVHEQMIMARVNH